MGKLNLSSYFRNELEQIESKKEPGPYVTISRQYGCDGYELGELLVRKLNERQEQEGTETKWRLFKKELLKQLAAEAGLAEDVIEKERLSKPSLLKDFLQGVRRSSIPDGYEIRNKITIMVRTVAFEGYAVIVGQSGTAATVDIDNGLSVRLEASKEWRTARVCIRENLQKVQATAKIEEVEKNRMYLRKLYEQKNPREPAFNLVIDNSMFNIGQAAELIIFSMEQKNLISKAGQHPV